MKKLKINTNGEVEAVWDDTLDRLDGQKEIKRATNLEFNNERQEWVAVDLSGNPIAVSKTKQEALQQEHTHIEKNILCI